MTKVRSHIDSIDTTRITHHLATISTDLGRRKDLLPSHVVLKMLQNQLGAARARPRCASRPARNGCYPGCSRLYSHTLRVPSDAGELTASTARQGASRSTPLALPAPAPRSHLEDPSTHSAASWSHSLLMASARLELPNRCQHRCRRHGSRAARPTSASAT